MSKGTQRRLAAIVSADVVGYSRLMGRDEAGTLNRLKAHRSELIDGLIEKHGGRIVKTTGDGLLLEFPSVVAAVECCIAVQEGMAERNADAGDEAMLFWIGAHLGDVIIEGDDIFGDGVNIAVRLQEISEIGGVAISSNAHDSVQGRIEVEFTDGGDQELKNIARTVRVWRWSVTGGPPIMPNGSEPMPLADIPSIAVLPFNNMSGDPEQEYFSDGLTEDIITALSYWQSFSVIARNSTFQYKGKSPDVRQVAMHLGVQYVLEGSVRRSGNRVRINAQLIDGATGSHIWANRFDRKLDDFFELQDEITQLIAAKVEPEFAKAEQRKAARKSSNNLDAWENYQRGIASLNELTKEGNLQAQEFFARAVEIDPGNCPAHAGMAYCLFRYSYDGFSDQPVLASDECIEYAKRAVALDDGDAQAHEILAVLLIHSGDLEAAISEARRAVEINPNYAHAHIPLGNALNLVGKPSEGIPYLEKAVRLNPDDIRGHIYLSLLADAHLSERDYGLAGEWARKAIERKRDYPHPYMTLASALGHQGKIQEATNALAECLRLNPNYLAVHPSLEFYRDPADKDHYLEGLRLAGLPIS